MKKNNKYKLYALLIMLSVISGCSIKEFSIKKLNEPTEKEFIEKTKKDYNISGYITYKKFESYFERRKDEIDRFLETRKKALDSLRIINKYDFTIIDKHSHNVQGEYDRSYIFYGDTIAYYYMPQAGDIDYDKFYLFKYSKRDLLNVDGDVLQVKKDFNQILPNSINLKPYTQPFTRYYITVVKNKKINYYRIRSEDFKVTKLK